MGVPAPGGMLSALYSPAARRYWIEGYITAADRQSRLSSMALADEYTCDEKKTETTPYHEKRLCN